MIFAAAPPTTMAFSTFHADDIMEAHKNVFYVHNGGSGYFRKSTADSSRLDFWKSAECFEMVIDAVERTNKASWTTMLNSLLAGFTAYHGTDWSSNPYNDDVMWAVLAYARAYRLTGNVNYRNIAKSNYDMVYARAWDAAGGGGFFWKTAPGSLGKNSAVNFSATLAAYYLYLCFNDSAYLTKAQATFAWGKAHLWDSNTGKVNDSTNEFDYWSYNQGTFIGAAHFLGDVSAATLAANHAMNNGTPLPSGHRTQPNIDGANNEDGGGFNGIFYRWVSKFVLDRGLQATYMPWLLANAEAHWNNRRTSDGLSWNKALAATPSRELWAFECMPSVVALQVLPAGYISNTTYRLKNRTNNLSVATNSGATSNNTTVVCYTYNGSNSMKWNILNVGGNQYRLLNVASNRALSINTSTGGQVNGDYAKIYDYSGSNQQKVTVNGRHGAFYEFVFVHSGKSLTVSGGGSSQGTPLLQWTSASNWNNQFSLWNP